MNKTKDGGSAFPQVNVKDAHGMLVPDRQAGMTLRDYFAAKAMQAIYTSQHWESVSDVADEAYLMADAMLEAREK